MRWRLSYERKNNVWAHNWVTFFFVLAFRCVNKTCAVQFIEHFSLFLPHFCFCFVPNWSPSFNRFHCDSHIKVSKMNEHKIINIYYIFALPFLRVWLLLFSLPVLSHWLCRVDLSSFQLFYSLLFNYSCHHLNTEFRQFLNEITFVDVDVIVHHFPHNFLVLYRFALTKNEFQRRDIVKSKAKIYEILFILLVSLCHRFSSVVGFVHL